VYELNPLAADWGEGWQLRKLDGTTYEINLGNADDPPTCNCLGFERWGSRGPCKHLAALMGLKEKGEL
jgi:hypothetical protein